MRLVVPVLLLTVGCAFSQGARPWSGVEKILHREGRQVGATFTVSAPRSDLQVSNSAGMLIPLGLGIDSEISFQGAPRRATATGWVCVLAHEIAPVLDRLLAAKIEIRSLGSRSAGADPQVFFLSFAASGDGNSIANTFAGCLTSLGKEPPINEGLKRDGKAPTIDWKAVSAIFHQTVRPDATEVARVQWTDGWAGLYGCKCGKTMAMAELLLTPAKAQAVIRQARKSGLLLTSFQQEDRRVRLRLEGEGSAVTLSKSLRAAHEATSGSGSGR